LAEPALMSVGAVVALLTVSTIPLVL
jgi:hypothetical protein